MLLVASYVFYMFWKPSYAILLLISTITVYYSALLMSKTAEKTKRKKYIWISIFVNLGILFFFKYFNFFADSLVGFTSLFGANFQSPSLKILLPVGISFYTFQAIGYSIDVYRGNQQAERHFGRFALFISFFPQLVAGPIERSKKLLPQLNKLDATFDYPRISAGLKLILWGFFKKVVIADNLGIFVNEIYNQPELYGGFQFVLASVLFGFQIYCDFSGYSDIAIGIARIMGVKLMINFKTPFFAKSISEFWNRWHISLSSWLRDYLFLPLAWKFSNRLKQESYGYFKSTSLIYTGAVLITFALTGLWHGANWTFVIWGLLHALYLLFDFYSKKARKKFFKSVGIKKKSKGLRAISLILTFVLVSFAWIFFRANSTSDAFFIIQKLFSAWDNYSIPELDKIFYVIGGVVALVLMIIIEIVLKNKQIESLFENHPRIIRWSFYYLLIAFIFVVGYFGDVAFIYFQF